MGKLIDLDGLSEFKTKLLSLVGENNGIAGLDSAGKIPSAQLPSYVDDVVEYADASSFPLTGETGKIYIALDTNITYRWGGSEYVVIGSSLALGETSSTAYRGDRGKTAYDHASAKGSAFESGLYKITTNSEGHVTAASAVQKSDITGLGIPAQDTTYSEATSSTAGLVKIGYTQSGDNYPVQLSDGKMYVSVPINGYVAVDQGSSNVGKFLVVNSSGMVVPTTVPAASGVSF